MNTPKKMAQVTEIEYREAQNGDSKVRQQFCEAVDLEDEARDFIDAVRYSAQNFSGEGVYMSCGSPKGICLATVYPTAFECPLNLFLSILIHHEGQHARQRKWSKPDVETKIGNRLYKRGRSALEVMPYQVALTEIPAYANEFVSTRFDSLREADQKIIKDNLDNYTRLLRVLGKSFHPITGFKKDLSKMLCDSPGDDWIREHILDA